MSSFAPMERAHVLFGRASEAAPAREPLMNVLREV
jgi:hypothetical protein